MDQFNEEIKELYKCIKFLVSTIQDQLLKIESDKKSKTKEKIQLRRNVIEILNKTISGIKTLNKMQLDNSNKNEIADNDMEIIHNFYNNFYKKE